MATAFADTTPRVPPPSKLLALTEVPRALAEMSALGWTAPLLLAAPRGDGHPVLVLPGFVTTDLSTTILRRYIKHMGYTPYAWELGRNLGPRAIGHSGERLIARLEAIHAQTGQTVSIVGWSLGGVMARLLAKWRPQLVRRVIALGSPFGGDPKSSNVWRAYEALTGQQIDGEHTQGMRRDSADTPPVPSTAIFTKGDGIVAWQNCREGECATTENVEVYGSHVGLGVNPAVLWVIADRLAQAAGEHTPFRRRGIGWFVYPTSTETH